MARYLGVGVLCLAVSVLALFHSVESRFPIHLPLLDLDIPEDAKLNMDQLLTKYKYPHEIHYVTTEDGYILKCYRVNKECSSKKYPLIIIHGLFSSSIDFINTGVGVGLGYLAADDCNDVWLCNSRGNFESRNHTTLKPNKKEFWQFSFHEMGQYDLPAIFNHVQTVTKAKKLNYIGYSQGTTQFFVYCSLYPAQCKEKINHMHALGPAAIMKHTANKFFRAISLKISVEKKLAEIAGVYELLPRTDPASRLGPVICSDVFSLISPCANFFTLMGGDNPAQYDKTFAQMAAANDPAGSSVNQVAHYCQLINSGVFEHYNHNMDSLLGNIRYYGQSKPPRYKAEKMDVPMTFYYGRNDLLTNYTDVIAFSKRIPNVTLYEVKDPHFGHIDFTFAKDVKTLVNDVVISNLRK